MGVDTMGKARRRRRMAFAVFLIFVILGTDHLRNLSWRIDLIDR